jgi:glucose-1-phosphate cytidylyltransferase
MKVVIFAGGIGSRISEESHLRPKPMIEIGGKPILWHIMKIYAAQGFTDFIICLGYRGYMIKEYFLNYYMHHADVTVNLANNDVEIHNSFSENFKVTLVDTGLNTRTAGRLKRIEKYIDQGPFMLTYGDGVADVDLQALVKFHHEHGKIATVTAIQPEGKFGGLEFDPVGKVSHFKEKPAGDKHWINGGFFVLNKNVFNYLGNQSDQQMWEDEPMETLTTHGELMAYKHNGFWRCMDALRDKVVLEELWESGNAKWKIW